MIGIEIQEVTPDGDLVWHWDSRDHIGLDETGRWWDDPILDNEPYDVVHWNSAELVGKHRLLLSFRHLDAVYEIDRRSGDIVWKLGGTDDAGEPRRQRTTRMATTRSAASTMPGSSPTASITVHDNRTGARRSTAGGPLPDRRRGRHGAADPVDRRSRTIPDSFCCGSARRLDSGDWLIGWGGNGLVGGYDADGDRLFDLQLAVRLLLPGEPRAEGVVTVPQLRAGMDAMAARP